MPKICFIISSIGGEGTPERAAANEKLNHYFKPVLEDLNYDVVRADQEETPGSISRLIVERIINSDMVIADISDQNPNVFYEIAIRNAVKKPIILIRSPEQKPPFDIQDTRAIAIDMSKPDIWRPAMEKLKKQIESAEANPTNASDSILSDFTFSIESETKEDPESVLLRAVKDLQGEVRRIANNTKPKSPTMLDIPTISSIDWSKIKISDFTIPDIKVPDHIKCKYCELDFPITVLFGTIANKTKQKAECSHCKQVADYRYDEMFFKKS